MATVTVYNRDGTEYGTLDTSKYIFNNKQDKDMKKLSKRY